MSRVCKAIMSNHEHHPYPILIHASIRGGSRFYKLMYVIVTLTCKNGGRDSAGKTSRSCGLVLQDFRMPVMFTRDYRGYNVNVGLGKVLA